MTRTTGRTCRLWLLYVCAFIAGLAAPVHTWAVPVVPESRVLEIYRKVPLSFEANQGQTDSRVHFLSRGNGYSLFLTASEAVLLLNESTPPNPQGAVLRMRLLGANPAPRVTGLDPLPGRTSYLLGADPGKWHTGIANYERIRYSEVYPGVDLLFYGNQRQLEHDFVVAPGADPGAIRLAFEGANEVRLDEQGDLVLQVGSETLHQKKPFVYQEVNGQRRTVAGRYVIAADHRVSFAIGDYDPRRPLVIDPVLVYSTYLGGTSSESGTDIVVDSTGHAYVTGWTYSGDFPVSPEAFDTGFDGTHQSGIYDVFVTKLNATGSQVVYSTYLGGSREDIAYALAVDGSGHAYVTGTTYSPEFPTTPGAFDRVFETSPFGYPPKAFITKLASDGGSLIYSTFLGGIFDLTESKDIALDSTGHAYVTGRTGSRFPVTPGALQTGFTSGVFVAKLNAEGTALIYGTVLGTSHFESGLGIAVDAQGCAYVTGRVATTTFPTTPGAFQPVKANAVFGFSYDAFVAKLNPEGSAFLYSTYLGGTGGGFGANNVEGGEDIAVDATGNAYVVGLTESPDFPTTPGAFDTSFAGHPSGSTFGDMFVAKLNADGSRLIYSTYLGGAGLEEVSGIWPGSNSLAVDAAGRAYVTGYTQSPDFPLTPDALEPRSGHGFVARLNPAGTDLEFSSYFGGRGTLNLGIAVDRAHTIYLTGISRAFDLPTTPGSFQPIRKGAADEAFVAVIATGADLSVAGIGPNRGGDTGSLTALVRGTGFVPGMTVKLVRAGQPDILAEVGDVAEGGALIAATFDLRSRVHGAWDVVVTSPAGRSITLPGAFVVEPGRSDLWVDILGRNAIRAGREQTFTVLYGNRGNVDAIGVPLWISIPKHATLSLGFKLQRPPSIDGVPDVNWDEIPDYFETDQEKILFLLLPFVSPAHTGTLRFTLRTSAVGQQFEVRAWVAEPLVQTSLVNGAIQAMKAAGLTSFAGATDSGLALNKSLAADAAQCAQELILIGLEALLGGLLGVDEDCLDAGLELAANAFSTSISFAADEIRGNLATPNQQTEAVALSGIDHYLHFVIVLAKCSPKPLPPFLSIAIKVLPAIYDGILALHACKDLAQGLWNSLWQVIVVGSFDPNDKIGAWGVGTPRYISSEEPLRYAVYFENVETATAAAQEVVVTDQLDPAKMDLDTFSLGPMGFGDKQIVPPPGLSEYTADVDLRPEHDLIARVDARLDRATGRLTWRFSSLDPATGQLTEDPLTGFLPPNVNPPEGDGLLLFTVRPKPLATGEEIRNRASIVFDANAPIETPEWRNTLDNSEPASHVLPLAETQHAASFPVQWSGTDLGSGVLDYTVFVSEDGGPFEIWQRNISATSAVFSGEPDKTYAFYSVARDATGNLEAIPVGPDTRTRVVIAANLSLSAQASPAPVLTGSSLTYTFTITNHGPSEAASVELTAQLPASTALVSCGATPGVCGGSGGAVTVSLASLPAGGSATVTLVAGVECALADGTLLDLTAALRSATLDPDGSDNSTALTTPAENPAPLIAGAAVSQAVLWPANHRMVEVAVRYQVTDNCGPITCALSVASNEPVQTAGTGDRAPDWEVVDANRVRLRAERSGNGRGRLYTIPITCRDSAGGTTVKPVTVSVPHDQGRR